MDGKSLIAILIFISGCAISKKNPTKGNPPGTLKINDSLFVDQTEVANIHWREYLYYLEKYDSSNASNALPDTLVWRDSMIYNEPMVEYYFRHPAFSYHPVVGASYEQVIEFCKWRTFAANQAIYFRENKIHDYKNHLTDTFPIRFYYRLPTKTEWEMIAAVGIDSNNRFFKKYKTKEIYNYNIQETNDSLRKKYHYHYLADLIYTVNIKSYFTSKYGTYNMAGNVAEMISEKGIAKGGSFIHPLDSCRVWVNQRYQQPEYWLGFRCVAIKIK